jgi:hypothetical protein
LIRRLPALKALGWKRCGESRLKPAQLPGSLFKYARWIRQTIRASRLSRKAGVVASYRRQILLITN